MIFSRLKTWYRESFARNPAKSLAVFTLVSSFLWIVQTSLCHRILPRDVIERAGEILENLEDNAVGYSGQPATVRKIRETSAPYRTKKKKGSDGRSDSEDGPVQPSLFE